MAVVAWRSKITDFLEFAVLPVLVLAEKTRIVNLMAVNQMAVKKLF